jgi:acylphosphatase
MQTQVKRYSVTIRGKVQHIGYRGIIEGTGRKLDLKGYVFNDVDNSVKIVCEGLQKSVDNFLSTLKDFARADIESIEKKEIHEDFPLPHLFSRVATDEYYEFSRKFDIGLDYLDGIKTDTGEMKGTLGDMKCSLNSIDNTLGTFVIEQKEHNQWMKDHLIKMDEHNQWMKDHVIKMDEHNQWMKEHNQRLEKILEKLAER